MQNTRLFLAISGAIFAKKCWPRFSNQISWVLPSTIFFHLITVTEAHWLEEFEVSVPSPFKTATPIRNSCVYTGILTGGGFHVLFLPIPGEMIMNKFGKYVSDGWFKDSKNHLGPRKENLCREKRGFKGPCPNKENR